MMRTTRHRLAAGCVWALAASACTHPAPPAVDPEPASAMAEEEMMEGDTLVITHLAPGDPALRDGFVERALRRAVERRTGGGLVLVQPAVIGVLDRGASVELPVTLAAGTQYQIEGSCDAECINLDLVMMDSRGAEVDRHDYADASPGLEGRAASGGRYLVRVVMTACAQPRCGFALVAYREP